jgi:hypothetical protein
VARSKTPQEERETILRQPSKRPYGAIVRVHVLTAGAFGQVEETEIPLSTGAFVSLAPSRSAPWDGGRRYAMKLEGFATASAAEAAARRLVQAVLWMAVSSDVPLRLDYQSYDPFAIFERSRSDGVRVEAYGEAYFQPDRIFGEIKEAYSGMREPNPTLLLSMEIFAGARMEASDRARFLAIVSALEPLAQEQPLGDEVDGFVDSCLRLLKETSALTPSIRASLDGRLRHLRTESIRQALRRVVLETLPDQPKAAEAIDDAYALRSQIVHHGRPADLDVDLERESRRVSGIIRHLYSRLLGRELMRPIDV